MQKTLVSIPSPGARHVPAGSLLPVRDDTPPARSRCAQTERDILKKAAACFAKDHT